MFKKSFKIHIRLGLITVFTIMLLVVFFLFVQIVRISDESQILYDHPYKVSNVIKDLKIKLYMILNLKRDMQYTDNKHQLDSLQNRIVIYNNSILNDFNFIHSKYLGNLKDVDSAFTAYKVWKTIIYKFYELKTENKTDNIRFVLKTENQSKFNNILIHLNVISEFAKDKAESTIKKVVTFETNSKFISIIMIIISCLMVIFLIIYLSHIITRPIKAFVSEANMLLKNEKTSKVKIANEEDLLFATIAEIKTSYLRIESQNNEINNFNKQLEEKVNQQTAELALANKELVFQNEEKSKRAAELALANKDLTELYTITSHLSSIVDCSNDAIISKSLDGRIKSWNNAAEKMFGYTAEEAIGENVSLIIPLELINEEKTILDKILNNEIIEHYETVRMKKSGEQFPVSLTMSPLKERDGNIVGISKIVRDITQRIRGEVNLAASEVRYRRLFEAARGGILILDVETGMIVDVNPYLIEILGYTYKEFLGKTIWDVGFFKDIILNKENFLELQQKEYIRYENLPLETSDGQIAYVEFVSNVYLVNNQKVIQCNIRDITERKQAEEERLKSDIKYKNLVSDMQVGLLIQGPKAEMIICNNKALELLDLTEDQLLGKTSFDPYWNVIHEDGSAFPGTTHPVVQAIETRKSVENIIMGVFRPTIDDRIWLLVSAKPQLNRNGDVDQVVCSFIDITKRLDAQKELLRSENKYSSLFNHMQEGFALHEIICDAKGKPVDYRFLDLNPAFEQLTGLKKTEIIGKTVLSVIPDTELFWIEKYGDVALNGKSVEFENYSAQLKRHYQIKAFSPAKNQFAVIFTDITDRKQAEELINITVKNLKSSNNELEQFNLLAVGRELRMVELKQQINSLSERLGLAPPHDLEFVNKK